MKILLTILVLCFSMAVQAEMDGEAIDSSYFHPAASLYIHGDLSSASNLVANGLSVFPENGKLLRLKELIEQEQQKQDQQQQQNQDQQNQDQQNQDQNKDQQNQDQQNQDNQQDPDQQDNQQDPDQQDEQKPEEQENQEQEQEQQPQDQQPQDQPRAEQMSEDEAKRLLDGMKQDEKNKRLQLHPVMGAPVKVDKDW